MTTIHRAATESPSAAQQRRAYVQIRVLAERQARLRLCIKVATLEAYRPTQRQLLADSFYGHLGRAGIWRGVAVKVPDLPQFPRAG